MSRIQFGLVMPADQLDKTRRATFVDDLDRALRLVSGHFDSAWIIDHLQFGDQDVLESFTALAYMAARHPQLKFGHTVLCQSFRNPALLAKMAATLQFLSGGRFILGIGAEAEALAGDRFSADNDDDFGFVGTPQQVIDQMQRFVDLGVDYFMLDCGGFPKLTTLELLVNEVLPVWNGGTGLGCQAACDAVY